MSDIRDEYSRFEETEDDVTNVERIRRAAADDLNTSRFSQFTSTLPECNCRRVGIVSCSFMALLLLVSMLFMYEDGYFSRIHNDPPSISNKTAMEPNTGIPFNFTIRPLNGNGIHHLIGVGLKVFKIPIFGTTAKVYAFGLYVDWTEGKRQLARWRTTSNDDNFSPKLVDALVSGNLGMSMHAVQIESPPKQKFVLDGWFKEFKPLLLNYTDNDVAAVDHFQQLFKQWFAQGFHHHDTFTLQWQVKENKRLKQYQDLCFLQYNEKMQKPAMHSPFCRALFTNEVTRRGAESTNLLRTLWDDKRAGEKYMMQVYSPSSKSKPINRV